MWLVESGLSQCYKMLHFSPPSISLYIEVDSKPPSPSDLRYPFQSHGREGQGKGLSSLPLLVFVLLSVDRESCVGLSNLLLVGAFNTLSAHFLFLVLLILWVFFVSVGCVCFCVD